MMNQKDVKQHIRVAYSLLLEDTTDRQKFESIRTLIKDINPRLDKILDSCSEIFSTLEKLQEGEVIDITAVHLPERTEKERKRKKTLLLFIKTWKELKNEVERVKTEFENMQNQKSSQEQVSSITKIIMKAKGPFGIITIAAIVIIGIITFKNSFTNSSLKTNIVNENNNQIASKIKVIIFEDKKIPLSETKVGSGPECEGNHYHAVNGISAKSLDGSEVPDPGGCGYGKVKEVSIVEVEKILSK